ncbi:MarR family winged helix-turn-helix transcriptional regulator [Nocardia sp. NBC_01329]|uniref:MarR family winged helix-turn-helix transcriptional regulator n=1 Tax=Nocardia sp. NBC_01329 TaxID=2903594 RepID=UPI002E13B078|nr:MarR family transcriptional regulator [Nocardia sp. NBC_01329]
MASESETSTLIEQFVLAVCDPGKWQGVDRMAELDLTLSQARVLFSVVRHTEPQPIHTIADELGLSMTAAGRNVDRLVRLGLLTRQESPTDRRVKLVGPTEHGHHLAWDQIAIHLATIDKVVDRLPDALREDLGRVLAAVLESGAVHNVVACPPASSGDNS